MIPEWEREFYSEILSKISGFMFFVVFFVFVFRKKKFKKYIIVQTNISYLAVSKFVVMYLKLTPHG